MQRGILTISKEELDSLFTILDIGIFSGTQLFEKLNSASGSIESEVRILLSEDEIETILDEIGPPTYENSIVNNAIAKISTLKTTLRPHKIS